MESIAIISAYLLDLVFGDPEWFPHPIRLIGKLITFLDNKLRANEGRLKERVKGVILAFTVTGISGCLVYLFLQVSGNLSSLFGNLAWVYLGYTTLSIKTLGVKAKAVLNEVENGSIVKARAELSKIVGRDTKDLDESKIIKATIESIAESTNDGIIAPLFYLIIGGPVLAVLYKTVNTLDSMIGYKNKKYIDFGWFSAKLDDVMNFIPARIAGFLISISSAMLGKNSQNSLKAMLRDGKKHPSPNSGITEASMAGALGIKLGGPSTYNGALSDKPYLGEDIGLTKPELINDALHIAFITSLIMLFGGALFKWVI